MNKILFVILIAFSFLSDCSEPVEEKYSGMPIVLAIKKSTAHANGDRINWSEYSIWLVMRGANGMAYAIDRESADEYQLSIIQKLKDKRYWEVCYGPSRAGMVGATYCYYLDYSNYELIAKYVVK